MNKTYIAVMDYDGETYLNNVFVLCWDNDEDWFGYETGDELLTKNNNLKRHPDGLVCVRNSGIYIDEDPNVIEEYAEDVREEGYDFVTCELFQDTDGEWKVKKVLLGGK